MEIPPELRRRILVVDGSASSRRTVRIHLEADSVVVFEAPDGFQAIAVAQVEQPDLILLNTSLPVSDGFETIKRFKEDSQTRAIPVIFLSKVSATSVKAKGLDLGAVDFITQPFDPVELRARVRAAIRTKSLQDLLAQRAYLDGLTGLGNRLALEERLLADWSLCRRRGTSLAVLIADLDRFKAVNDRHGHPAGDTILQGTARALRESVRVGDFVARYGGEEFVVVAPDCDIEGAVTIAERFRLAVAALRDPFLPEKITITTSVGACSCALLDGSPELLLHRADSALYHAKAAGRDAVWAYDRGGIHPALHFLGVPEVPALQVGISVFE